MESLTLNSPNSFQIKELVSNEYKQTISALLEENSLLKNKLAILQDILHRYKLNDMTELIKELVHSI